MRLLNEPERIAFIGYQSIPASIYICRTLPSQGGKRLNVEKRLQLNNELPLVVRHVLAVKLLESVDALSRDQTVQSVALLEVTAIDRLGAAHLDLDSH